MTNETRPKGPRPQKTVSKRQMEQDWASKAKNLLRAEMTRRGVNYAQLAEKLEAIGVNDNDRNLANKIARGGFSAAFFLQCMSALDVQTLHLEP